MIDPNEVLKDMLALVEIEAKDAGRKGVELVQTVKVLTENALKLDGAVKAQALQSIMAGSRTALAQIALEAKRNILAEVIQRSVEFAGMLLRFRP